MAGEDPHLAWEAPRPDDPAREPLWPGRRRRGGPEDPIRRMAGVRHARPAGPPARDRPEPRGNRPREPLAPSRLPAPARGEGEPRAARSPGKGHVRTGRATCEGRSHWTGPSPPPPQVPQRPRADLAPVPAVPSADWSLASQRRSKTRCSRKLAGKPSKRVPRDPLERMTRDVQSRSRNTVDRSTGRESATHATHECPGSVG